MPAESIIVDMRKVVKRFPGVVANRGVDFELREGEIHALLGENGAGKTTLMNILYGLYEPDEGEVVLRGRSVCFSSPRDAIEEGLGMVHQHFMLVQPFTVAENIVLGQRSPREPLTEKASLVHKRVRELSDQYGLRVDPDAQVWTLSVGEQQRVEILKTLYRGAEILILDEPTAVLTPQEVDELLVVLRRMKGEGKSIVFISHKLREVLELSDRITVLRDGGVVDTVAAAAADRGSLARMMVDREVLLTLAKQPARPAEALLEVKDLEVRNDRGLHAVRDASFEVHAGEILGIAGVAGNGQFELEEAIAGLRRVEGGSIKMCGRNTTNGSPRDMGAWGLAHIPSDRYRMGLLPDFTIAENLMLQRIGRRPFTRRGVLDWRGIHREAGRLATAFDVRTPSVEVNAGTLSGGNAQKMILARELARNPRVLLAAQPTRGLDVSAIEFIHRTLIEQRDNGMAILLFSTELDEILNLSDRIAVMCGGRIVDIMDSRDVNVYDLGLLMGGVDPCACVGDDGGDVN
jgi:simple sugar transport system ATP-binding protein